MTEVIAKFLASYEREFEFYQEVASMCAGLCSNALKKGGIRAIVTHRAKAADKLVEKLRSRDAKKNYKSEMEIREDIVDLSGVRVAVYFPNDSPRVERLVNDLFDVAKVKRFPIGSDRGEYHGTNYKKKFSGYGASHFHVKLKADGVDARFSRCIAEIQVASVIMHGWAEVEHDLVYKPNSGALSGEEHAYLDALNGLVLAGETLLEQLASATVRRLGKPSGAFANQYELGSYLIGSIDDGALAEPGNVDILLEFLIRAGLNKVENVQRYAKALNRENVLAEGVAAQAIRERSELASLWVEVSYAMGRQTTIGEGYIILDLEEAIKVRGPSAAVRGHYLEPRRTLDGRYVLPPAVLNDAAHRNHHGFLSSRPRGDIVNLIENIAIYRE